MKRTDDEFFDDQSTQGFETEELTQESYAEESVPDDPDNIDDIQLEEILFEEEAAISSSSDEKKKKEKKKKKKPTKLSRAINIGLIVLCVIVLVVAIYKISSVYIDYHDSTEAINTVKADSFSTDDEYDLDFDALLEQNDEAVGWIRMKGDALENGDVDILIDYPIVQTTDNSYYVERGIDKSYSAFGTLFVDYRCADGLDSSHALVWGHNMTYPDHAMFGYINLYEDDEDFYEKYPYYDVWVGDEHYIYKVFACGVVEVGGFFFTYSFDDDYTLLNWIDDIYDNMTIFDTDISEFDEDSKIISMVACLYPTDDDYRFAVLMYRLDD